MLIGIDPLLTPELLYVLAAMGHGDDLVIADANFPAYSTAPRTRHGQVLTLPGSTAPAALRAVLSLLPLDNFVDQPVRTMAVEGSPDEIPPVQRELQEVVDNAAGRHWPLGALSRTGFYEAAGSAYAVVITGERRLYGNVLVKKGVVPPDGSA